MNKTQLKNFKPSQEMIDAAITVFQAKAYTELVKPVVEAYKQQIVDAHCFQYDPKHVIKGVRLHTLGRITKTMDMWLANDDDANEYYRLCDLAKKEAGFTDLEPGYCPLLVAEDLERQANCALSDLMQPVTGIDHRNLPKVDLLNRLEDINLRFMAWFL
jgi:hypothetical protein